MGLGTRDAAAPRGDVSQHAEGEASSASRNVAQGEMSGFETALAKMRGGVVYTLLCVVNSICTLFAILLIAVVALNEAVPDQSSPVWTPVNAFILWAARTSASLSGIPAPGSLDDMVLLVDRPLFVAWIMVALWLPYAVLCAVAALLGGFFGWRGPGWFPLLGRFAVAVNLPGRIWTGFVRLLFGWAFRRKMQFMAAGLLSMLGLPTVANPFPVKTYRWGNQYGSGWKSKDMGFNPLFLVAVAIQLFLFLVTVISWSVSAMPYLVPVIGPMLRSETRLPDSTVATWSVAVVFIGLTLGIWVPAACDFYQRYGTHLTIRQRFDWFPLMPKLSDLAGVGGGAAGQAKTVPATAASSHSSPARIPASDAHASSAASTMPPVPVPDQPLAASKPGIPPVPAPPVPTHPVPAPPSPNGPDAQKAPMAESTHTDGGGVVVFAGLLIIAAPVLLVVWLVVLLFHGNVPWLLIAAVACFLIGAVIAGITNKKQ